MDLLLEHIEDSMPIVLHPPAMTDDDYYAFCRHYERFRIERMADGSVVFMAPVGLEGSFQNAAMTAQLSVWARADGRGKSFESSVEYILPDGSALSPDASWVHQDRIGGVAEKWKFPRLCPDFVIELLPPSDRLAAAKRKMQLWIDNGVELGWLIDPKRTGAIVYRPHREPEAMVSPERLVGDGPVAGFVLELSEIWAGL